ncbi:IPT/TIG domain-containing protein [Paludibaculum fermentans]|uniref:IPT/TIG domain-containing protein n=1 Tax=Paludibaculum fermentans TaxID=1473598 RepID=A0A7S7NNQ2_PALFE|nr:IPT/TIG domain-containing protein [Paludibaculum fermentans]QOY86987.1 IPT/TIG domain-containing protein [Paludibaculum fermentans]
MSQRTILPLIISTAILLQLSASPPTETTCAGYTYNKTLTIERSSDKLKVIATSTIGGYNPCSFYTYVDLTRPSGGPPAREESPGDYIPGLAQATVQLPILDATGTYATSNFWKVQDDSVYPPYLYLPTTEQKDLAVAPIISTVTPSNASQRSGVQMVISGLAFGTSPTVNIDGASSINVASASSTSINVSFDSSNMSMGAHNVTVTNNLTSNSATFTASCIEPTGFHQTVGTPAPQGWLYFRYEWVSPTGNLADLNRCSIREVVRYPSGSVYYPPSPPWPTDAGFINPTIYPPNDGRPASYGFMEDQHKLSSTMQFAKPYSTNSFVASQDYEFRCTCGSNTDWTVIGGFRDIQIVRSITNESGRWQYKIEKSGVSNTYDLP